MSNFERSTEIRQQNNPNELALQYPYEVLTSKKYYHLRDYGNVTIPKRMPEEKEEERVENFPSCITHYYWIYEGTASEEQWRALFKYYDVKTKRERFGFFIAGCGYSGFDCCGEMKLYVSDNFPILINKALSDCDYKLYTCVL